MVDNILIRKDGRNDHETLFKILLGSIDIYCQSIQPYGTR